MGYGHGQHRKAPKGWAAAPEGAQKFTIYTSGGMVRRTALILRNKQGIYHRIAIYRNKKDTEPLFVVEKGTPYYVDDVVHNGQHILSSCSMKILELAEDGSRIRLWMSTAYDIHCNGTWYPKTLLQDIIDHGGYPGNGLCGCRDLIRFSWILHCAGLSDGLKWRQHNRGGRRHEDHLCLKYISGYAL